MSDIPSFPYALLWEERQLLSLANLTRQDGIDFLGKAQKMDIVTHTTTYPLQNANQALADLRAGLFDGAAVLVPLSARHALSTPPLDAQRRERSGSRRVETRSRSWLNRDFASPS